MAEQVKQEDTRYIPRRQLLRSLLCDLKDRQALCRQLFGAFFFHCNVPLRPCAIFSFSVTSLCLASRNEYLQQGRNGFDFLRGSSLGTLAEELFIEV